MVSLGGTSIYLILPEKTSRYSTKKSSDVLYRYITGIYGAPSIDKNSPDLAEAYTADFDYHHDHATPLAIWETDQTRIVQLRIDDSWPIAYIYAEPLSRR